MNCDVSIIIVNYNSKELLFKCLCSIKSNVHVNYEVIIVDNNSSDNSFVKCKDEFKEDNIHFVKSDINLGFSKANNLAVKNANSKIYHFLNPDTIITEDINSAYLYAINNIDKVFVTPLINMDGSIENSKNCMPTIKNYLCRLFRPSNVKYWYIGASVLISSKVFFKIGKWCEEYFMYSEDMDLFYQINKFNIEIVELDSSIKHLGGGCSQNVWNSKERELIREESFYLFFMRNRTILEYFLFKALIITGLFFRFPTLASFKLNVWTSFLKNRKCKNSLCVF